MMIVLGIAWILFGIILYTLANRTDVTNSFLCGVGFLVMLIGAMFIAVSLEG